MVVNEANAASNLAWVNNPAMRVFCIEPGDYRSLGMLDLTLSGTQASRRYLRFNAPAGSGTAVQRTERALFETIRVRASWWVIQGLTVQPSNPSTYWFLSIQGGSYNVLDGNLIDGSDQANTSSQVGILLGAWYAAPATHNWVQRNVVRNGNHSRAAVDYVGVAVNAAYDVGGDNDFNLVLDNEVYDWGDGIALTGDRSDCAYPARPHATVIDGNDIYITGDKRIDCTTGAPDPTGDCACAENGVDLKPDPGPDPSVWTLVTNNRLWGFRPTRLPSTCGGSGAIGQAISSGNQCPGHVFVGTNVVGDAALGVEVTGPSWIIAGNLVYDVHLPVGIASALLPLGTGSGLDIEFNTIVGVDNAYDDMASNTETRCNVVIDNLGLNGHGGTRGANESTDFNFLYQSSAENFVGATNQVFPSALQSQNTEHCFWRKRWTSPELVCVPFGSTTAASPHSAAVANCNPNLGAPFGIGPIGYTSGSAVPEPTGALLGSTALAGLAGLAARRRATR
jgi:hypothetical protein